MNENCTALPSPVALQVPCSQTAKHWRSPAIAAAILALSLELPADALSQDRRAVRIPGAVRLPPAWAERNLPFAPAEYFRAVAPVENAAVAYLDALYEFSDSVDSCFPEPDFTSRGAIARERSRRFARIYDAYRADPSSVEMTLVRNAMRDYERGWAKLAAASRRPECLFERDVGCHSFNGHAVALRQLARALEIRTLLDIAERRPASAIEPLESVLRLSAAMRPRCSRQCLQDVLAADRQCCLGVVRQLVSASQDDAAVLPRLVELLDAHDAATSMGASEALRTDYVNARQTLDDLAAGRLAAGRAAEPLRRQRRDAPRGRKVFALLTDGLGMTLDRLLLHQVIAEQAIADPQLREALTRMRNNAELEARIDASLVALWLESALATMVDADYALEIAALNEWFLAADGWLKSATGREPPAVGTQWRNTKLLRFFLPPSVRSVWTMQAENQAWLRCAAVAAVGASKSANDAALAKAAVARLDPFDQRPLKWIRRAGRLVVYSVGPDAVDDKALRECGADDAAEQGDMVFRIPLVAKQAH